MKILHVVTLHTPDHAFGGPTRVALNLAKVQRAGGDDARIMALGDGFEGRLPREVEESRSFSSAPVICFPCSRSAESPPVLSCSPPGA